MGNDHGRRCSTEHHSRRSVFDKHRACIHQHLPFRYRGHASTPLGAAVPWIHSLLSPEGADSTNELSFSTKFSAQNFGWGKKRNRLWNFFLFFSLELALSSHPPSPPPTTAAQKGRQESVGRPVCEVGERQKNRICDEQLTCSRVERRWGRAQVKGTKTDPPQNKPDHFVATTTRGCLVRLYTFSTTERRLGKG